MGLEGVVPAVVVVVLVLLPQNYYHFYCMLEVQGPCHRSSVGNHSEVSRASVGRLWETRGPSISESTVWSQRRSAREGANCRKGGSSGGITGTRNTVKNIIWSIVNNAKHWQRYTIDNILHPYLITTTTSGSGNSGSSGTSTTTNNANTNTNKNYRL